MVCVWGEDAAKAQQLAETFRQRFAEIEFENAGHQTITLGVTHICDNDDPEQMCIRVDNALYLGKRSGKNKVVVL